MAYDGAGALFALGLRITRLDATGAPLVGAGNCYTTEAMVRVGFGQTYSEPDAVELKNGKGATCVYYAPPATLLGGTIEELRFCSPDPYVLQFLSGGEIITTGGVSEVQTVTIAGTPTGGTFTLTFAGQATAPIAFSATSAAVQTALRALPTIGAAGVTVTGGPGPTTAYVVSFAGPLASQNVNTLTALGSFTGGTTPTVTVATTTPGVSGSDVTGYRAPQVNVDPTPAGVALEAWSNAILDNSFSATLPYLHWVIPRARLRPTEAYVLSAEDPTQPVFAGTNEQNANFGDGPFNDVLFGTDRIYQYNRTATIPNLSAGLLTVTA